MDILNDILVMLISGVSHEHIVSMGVIIILTTVLLFIDAAQRITAEVLRYNKDNHRNLMSERLRSDLLTKLCVQYPAWMVLPVVFESLPDIPIPNTELFLDHIFSFLFMLIPFFSECWSIIENLREMVEDDLVDFGKVFQGVLEIIRAWRGNG